MSEIGEAYMAPALLTKMSREGIWDAHKVIEVSERTSRVSI